MLQPKELYREDLTEIDAVREVVHITVAAAPTNPVVKHPKTKAHLVHWRIHLHWKNENDEISQTTVVLDTGKLAADDAIVEIEVRSKDRMFSEKASQTWRHGIPMKSAGITVEDFIGRILGKGHHHYTYDANGSGCLFWTKTLIQDFADAGWIEAGEPTELDDFVLGVRTAYEWPTKPYWFPYDKGRFI